MNAITIELTDASHNQLKQEATRLGSNLNRFALAILQHHIWRESDIVSLKERQFQQFAASLFQLFLRLYSLWMAFDRLAIEHPVESSGRKLAEMHRRQIQPLLTLSRRLLDICLGVAAGQLRNFDPLLQKDIIEAAEIVARVYRHPSSGIQEKHTKAIAEYLVFLGIIPGPQIKP